MSKVVEEKNFYLDGDLKFGSLASLTLYFDGELIALLHQTKWSNIEVSHQEVIFIQIII